MKRYLIHYTVTAHDNDGDGPADHVETNTMHMEGTNEEEAEKNLLELWNSDKDYFFKYPESLDLDDSHIDILSIKLYSKTLD